MVERTRRVRSGVSDDSHKVSPTSPSPAKPPAQPSVQRDEQFTILEGFTEMQPCCTSVRAEDMLKVNSKTPTTIEQFASARQRVTCGIYKMFDDVKTPSYGSEWSACFDLRAYLGASLSEVKTFNRVLRETIRRVAIIPEKEYKRGIYLDPGEVALVPTGLIFDIPAGFKMLAYPRSGLSMKQHLSLANCVGVIDEDYTKQTMITIRNNSEVRQSICDGDRLAQAEFVPYYTANFVEIEDPPEVKTSRNGGFGSTNTQ